MITNIYKDKNKNDESELCVDICEVLYNILNQIYSFTKIINVKEIKDIKKISNKTSTREVVYIDISNYKGSAKTILRRLNLEAFVNINTTIVTIVPVNLLKFTKDNCMNISVEYVPKILTLADTIIEIEEELAIIIFNSKEVI
ncbi:hypothetical protein DAF96_18610 [Clostridioides difficile]|nr:hypothetical protein [Clostridioides difficile]